MRNLPAYYADQDFTDLFPVTDPQPVPVKDYLGRALDAEMLDWARKDEQVAGELRGIVHPDDHAALDQLIGDMGKSHQIAPPRVDPLGVIPDVQPAGGLTPDAPATPPTKPRPFPAWDNPVLPGQSHRPIPAVDTSAPPAPATLDFQSPQHFAASLEAAMGGSHPDPAESRLRAEAARFVSSRLPAPALQRLSEGGRLRAFISHATSDALAAQWTAATGEVDREVGGWYDNETGELVLNGFDPRGSLAHELTHALDAAGNGQNWWQLSTAESWKAAWRSDIQGGNLSDYATSNEVEGFAEFGRLLWGTDNGPELAQVYFPRAFRVFQQYGLV